VAELQRECEAQRERVPPAALIMLEGAESALAQARAHAADAAARAAAAEAAAAKSGERAKAAAAEAAGLRARCEALAAETEAAGRRAAALQACLAGGRCCSYCMCKALTGVHAHLTCNIYGGQAWGGGTGSR
jgi:hypothetical protein